MKLHVRGTTYICAVESLYLTPRGFLLIYIISRICEIVILTYIFVGVQSTHNIEQLKLAGTRIETYVA